MANETHKLLGTLTTQFKIFPRVCFTVQWSYSMRKLRTATIMTQFSFLPPDCITIDSGQDSQQQSTRASPKSVKMTTQRSTPTPNLSVGITYLLT